MCPFWNSGGWESVRIFLCFFFFFFNFFFFCCFFFFCVFFCFFFFDFCWDGKLLFSFINPCRTLINQSRCQPLQEVLAPILLSFAAPKRIKMAPRKSFFSQKQLEKVEMPVPSPRSNHRIANHQKKDFPATTQSSELQSQKTTGISWVV